MKCWPTLRSGARWTLPTRAMAKSRASSVGMTRRRSIFFFQAEDGIRGFHVTGVQTCALPIWPACRLSPGREASTAPWLRIGNTWLARWWRRPPSRDPTDGLFRVARATKRQGAGALAAQSAGDLSGPRMVARARPPVHPADPATRRRILLAAASGPPRPARPRTRGTERRTGRLGVAERQPQIVGRAAVLSRAA